MAKFDIRRFPPSGRGAVQQALHDPGVAPVVSAMLESSDPSDAMIEQLKRDVIEVAHPTGALVVFKGMATRLARKVASAESRIADVEKRRTLAKGVPVRPTGFDPGRPLDFTGNATSAFMKHSVSGLGTLDEQVDAVSSEIELEIESTFKPVAPAYSDFDQPAIPVPDVPIQTYAPLNQPDPSTTLPGAPGFTTSSSGNLTPNQEAKEPEKKSSLWVPIAIVAAIIGGSR